MQKEILAVKLPEGWEIKKLGDVAKVVGGGTPSRDKREYWENGTIPWLKISDLKSLYIKESEEKITKIGLENSSAKVFPKGTILFSVFATLGDVVILDIDAATNQAISGIFINNEKEVNKMYLVYYLKSLKDTWINKSKGVTQNNINQTILKETSIPIPPLPNQQKIVQRLDAFFSHYNKLKEEKQKAKENYEKILQSAIASLIPQKELSDDWNRDKLVNLCSKKPQYGYTATSVKEKIGHVYLRITDIDFKGNIDWSNIKYVKTSNEEHKKFKMDKGDIIVARTGATVGKSYLYNEEKDAIFASYLIRFRANTELLLPEYLFIFMQSSLYWNHISKEQSGTGQPNVNAQKLGNLEVIYPKNINLQRNIIKKISDLKNTIKNIELEQSNIDIQLSQLPKAVLSKAFRGEMVS